jgi:hypothetical protein
MVVAAFMALCAAGCASAQQVRASSAASVASTTRVGQAAQSGQAGEERATESASAQQAAFSATPIEPSAPATSGGCHSNPRVTFMRVSAVTEVQGVYWLTGHLETAECGPNVPDDVVMTDTGPVRSFAVDSHASYTLRGVDPTQDYAVSAALFMAVADGKGGNGQVGWWEGICALDHDSSGHLIAVNGTYSP